MVVGLIIIIFVPSKMGFLIMSMTKDYRPQQLYNMTKEESQLPTT